MNFKYIYTVKQLVWVIEKNTISAYNIKFPLTLTENYQHYYCNDLV